jgi:hypothetical protein
MLITLEGLDDQKLFGRMLDKEFYAEFCRQMEINLILLINIKDN